MKNIHMYNYLLAIKDETHIYKAIIETVPDENDSMMIGLDDFNFPQEEIEEIKNEITIIWVFIIIFLKNPLLEKLHLKLF